MTARKKATAARKNSKAKKGARRKTPAKGFKVGDLEFPRTLKGFQRDVRRYLSWLEREVGRAESTYRKRFARLLREGSHELGRLEEMGDRRWRDLTDPARRDLAKLLGRLEKAMQPKARAKKKARKKAARKSARKKAPRKASRKKSRAKKAS